MGQPQSLGHGGGRHQHYTPLQGYFTNVLVISAVFALINAPSVCVWAGCGSLLRNALRDPFWLRVFNGVMATLLVLSLYPLLEG